MRGWWRRRGRRWRRLLVGVGRVYLMGLRGGRGGYRQVCNILFLSIRPVAHVIILAACLPIVYHLRSRLTGFNHHGTGSPPSHPSLPLSSALLDSVRVNLPGTTSSEPLQSVAGVTVRQNTLWVEVYDHEVSAAVHSTGCAARARLYRLCSAVYMLRCGASAIDDKKLIVGACHCL